MTDLGNSEYRRACDTVLFPIAREFKPDLIIVSCGFDSALHDQLGWSRLTAMQYAYMTNELQRICPKVLVVQEGGYNINFLGQHASGVANSLIKGPVEDINEWKLEPTELDLEAGVKTFRDIDPDKCQPWA